MISDAEYQQAAAAPLGAKSNDYYFSQARELLLRLRQGAADRALRPGDRAQGRAEDLHDDRPRQAEGRARGDEGPALRTATTPPRRSSSIDPRNGYIRAMASSSSYRQVKYNYAAQGRRQAGSTFKVMVLMAALRKGINPNTTTYVSHPLDLNTPYGPWKVNTYSHSYGGSMNLVTATLQSDNTVYAQLDLDVGPDAVRQAAYDMGITTKLDGYPGRGPRRPAPRRLAAGDGERLRDDRLGRHPPQADRRHEGRVPRRQVRGPGQAQGQAHLLPGRGLGGDEDPRAEHPAGHRAQAPTSAARRRARPARSTTGPTPGSSASRPSSRRRSGSATRTRRCRCSACTGSGWPAARFPPRSGTTTWRTSPPRTARDFQPPAGSASFQPFFGKYSSNGYSGGGGSTQRQRQPAAGPRTRATRRTRRPTARRRRRRRLRPQPLRVPAPGSAPDAGPVHRRRRRKGNGGGKRQRRRRRRQERRHLARVVPAALALG